MSLGRRLDKMARIARYQLDRGFSSADLYIRRSLLAASGEDAAGLEARHWARTRAGMTTWQEHPVVRSYINRRISGDPEVNWLSYFKRKYAPSPFRRALNLGCGFGDLEAHAFSLGLAESFHSLDISGRALAKARQRLEGFPADFETADLNSVVLDLSAYDVAFTSSSLHHVVELERVLGQIEAALKPGGLLVINEFVGPSNFQWTREQLEIINRLLVALPQKYRKDLRRSFRLKKRVHRAPLDERRRDSPFEAVRSAEIVGLVRERFDVLEKKDYGGGVLHQLLDGIAGNFQPGVRDDDILLDKLCWLEERLESTGRVGSDFTFIIVRKRGGE